MSKQQTAGSGRSTPKRRPTAAKKPADRKARTSPKPVKDDVKTKTRSKPSSKGKPANATAKNTAKPKAATKDRRAGAKPPAEKPPRTRRASQRPVIAKQPGFSQRLGQTLAAASRALAAAGRTLRDPAFWRRVITKLPPWTDEVGALLLIVLGFVMLTALLNTTSEAALSISIRHDLRQLFGHGAYLVTLGVAISGVIILLPKFGTSFRLGWTRAVAIEVAFCALEALLHLFPNDPQARVLAREGGGGGFLGWSLMALLSPLGHTLSIAFFAIVFFGSLAIAFELRMRHLEAGILWLRTRLQGGIQRLDSMSFELPEPDDNDPRLPPAEHMQDWDVTPFEAEIPDFLGDPPTSVSPRQPKSSVVPRESAKSNGSPAPSLVKPGVTPPTAAKSNGKSAPDISQVHDSQGIQATVGVPDITGGNGHSEPPPAPQRSLTKAERAEIIAETRRALGADNGRSLVAPGEPGERSSVVPRELLPNSPTPRPRMKRKLDELSERYFTVDDFREAKKVGKRDANLPPLELLNATELNTPTEEEINTNARIIKNTLLEFDVETEVIDVKVGPTVTQYAVSPYTERVSEEGERVLNRVRVSEITHLSGDLALALSAKRLRIQAPVPGHSYVGVEVPNRQPSIVALRPVLESEAFYKYRDRPLALPLGRDVAGDAFVTDLGSMPHLLIAGTTGSGKSIMLAAMTTALVMNNTPEQVRLVLLDPKMVELARFNGLPHLLGPVETELDRIIGVLRWATREMDRRYKLLEKEAARNIDAFNKSLGRRRKDEHLPYIVIIVDEIGDLMMQRPDETERALTRLAQMARAVGMHLMVATQRPSVDVITGLIKANFPARISFAVASGIDSRVILDLVGAETLMGRGDMLFLAPDAAGPRRIQGGYVSDEEVNAIVEHWRRWHEAEIEAERMEPITIGPWERGMTRREVLSETDPMLEDAIDLVIEEGEASASLIQRRLGLGYPRAARIIDLLFELGIVGPARPGGRTRDVLVRPGSDPFKKIVDKRLKNKE